MKEINFLPTRVHERNEDNNIKNIENLFDSKDIQTHEKWNNYFKANLAKNIEKDQDEDIFKILI